MLVFVVVAASTFSLPQAHAQQSESTGPWRDPGINYLEDSKPYVQWILGVLFIAGCVLIAIKNPHRTHLD